MRILNFKPLLAAVVLAACISPMTRGSDDLSAYYGFDEIEIIKLDWGIGYLRVADFNGDGRNDLAIVNNGRARIDLLIQKAGIGPGEPEVAVDANDIDINALATDSRFDKQDVAVSQKMYSFVCGDLNGDSLTDMAFYGDPKGLYVLRQRAGEAQDGPRSKLTWRTPERIRIDDGLPGGNMLECADLNNDGRTDLALAGRDGIYIITQKDDGTLAEPVKYPTTATTLGVEAGDLDGDGITDLMLVTNDAQKPIHVRFGFEGGQLGPQVQFFIEKPFALKLYDLDGVGGDEIVSVDSMSGRLGCYEFVAESEDEGDWPVMFYPLSSGEGGNNRDLVVGDFTGDGLDDVAISEPGAAELILYSQKPGLGLAEPVRFPAFSEIKSMSAADIISDEQGRAEIAVLSVKEKVIGITRFENDRLTFPKPVDIEGDPVAMEVADVDGDGAADCVYVSKGSDKKTYLRVIYSVGSVQGTQEDEEREDFALELKGSAANGDELRVLDADQDGLADVLVFVSYELPVLVRQVEKGEFEVVESSQTRVSLIKDARLRSIAVADVDGKAGEELLVVRKNFARSVIFEAGESWSIVDQYNARSTKNQLSAVAAFEIGDKADGPAILLLDGQRGELQILRAGEDKTYRLAKELDVGKWGSAMHLKMLSAKLTGGGEDDILLFDGAKFAIVRAPNGGERLRSLERRFSYETKIKDGGYAMMAGGDINSDGWNDLIMVEYRRKHIEILAFDADMKPVPAMRFKVFEEKSYKEGQSQTKAGIEPREIQVADVTGDGKADLVAVIHDRVVIYPQD